MTKNMGMIDRIIRIVIGLALIVFSVITIFFILKIIWLGIILGVFGLILLITSFLGWCPLYMPFKISTKGDGK